MIKIEKEIIENYWRNNPHEFAGDRRSKLIVSLSKKYIGKKVLDVGAGSGALIKLIPGTIGIDIIPNKFVQKGDITKLEFKDKYFDTIFSTEVIEHLNKEDIKKSLNEIKRVLKDNGYFILTVPFNEDLQKGIVICPKCNFKFHLWEHLHNFNKRSIKNLLEESGFKIVKIKDKSFRLYEINPLLFKIEFLIKKIYPDISRTLWVVARKK